MDEKSNFLAKAIGRSVNKSAFNKGFLVKWWLNSNKPEDDMQPFGD